MIVEKNDTKSKILDTAERLIAQGGYGAFSFRDIADEIGIKSASVHYHFPTKSDLVAAVMVRYNEAFAQKLPNPDSGQAPQMLINGFIDGFKAKIVDQRNMSLCTMLTADKALLPMQVCNELAMFYQLKLEWLTKVFFCNERVDEDAARSQAVQLLACLHGASILVQGTDQPELFDCALSEWRTHDR